MHVTLNELKENGGFPLEMDELMVSHTESLDNPSAAFHLESPLDVCCKVVK